MAVELGSIDPIEVYVAEEVNESDDESKFRQHQDQKSERSRSSKMQRLNSLEDEPLDDAKPPLDQDQKEYAAIAQDVVKTPPWKFPLTPKTACDYGVPLLCILLIIAAASVLATNEKPEYTECLWTTEIPKDQIANTTSLDFQDGRLLCPTVKYDGLNRFEPISRGWQIVMALMPFVCVFQGVLAYDLSSRYVAPFTLIVTIVLGMTFFENKGWWVNSNIVEVAGLVFLQITDRILWTIFEYAFNVFTAFYFLRVLEIWGVVDQIRVEFDRIAQTPYRKVLLILFCFAVMIAVVAPGGSNFLIAGAIMVDINHSRHAAGEVRDEYDKRIGAICLFGNGLTSAFNLVGVCIIAIAADIAPFAVEDPALACNPDGKVPIDQEECGQKEIGKYFSAMFFLFSIVSPVIMAGLYSLEKGIVNKLKHMKSDIPIMLAVGTVYAVVQLISSWFIGPELVCLLSAGIALVVYIMIEQCSRHGPSMGGCPDIRSRLYWLPFVLLVLLLILIRLVPGLEDALKGGDNQAAQAVLNPSVMLVRYRRMGFAEDDDAGLVQFIRKFGWLAHSGMVVLVVSIATPFIVPYCNKVDEPTPNPEENEKQFHRQKTQYCIAAGGDLRERRRRNPKVLAKFQSAVRKVVIEKKVVDSFEIEIRDMRKYCLSTAFSKSIKEALPVMVSIGSYASIAKVMANFQMTQIIAEGIVDILQGAPSVFALFIPFIGMMGSALTGSTTTSNFLFGQLQVQTALKLGLAGADHNSMWEIAGDQVFGATAGEIISPMNAVFSTLLLGGRFPESDLMWLVLPIFVVWTIATMVVSVIFIVPTGGIS